MSGACHPHFYPEPAGGIPWPEELAGRSEVVIVGAGLSGLTAAYHLRHREVLVLEAGDSPGGVCRSDAYQGITYPAGSAYFYYPWNAAWRSWYRELGLPVDDALIAPPMSALFYEGRWFPHCFSEAGLRQLPLSSPAVDGLLRLAADLAEWEDRWDPLGAEALPQPELDRLSLAQYLKEERRLAPEVIQLLTPYCRSCLGAGPEAVSAWAGLYFLMSEFSPGLQAAAFPQGNARLVQALVQALPRPPRLQQTVLGLQPGRDSAKLLIWDGPEKRSYRWEAGVVILAVGKFMARHLLSPEWGWRREDFEAFRYSSYLVAALCGPLSLEAPGYENWVVGARHFSDFVMAPRAPRPGEPRVMVVFAPQPFPGGRQALLKASAAAKAEELLSDLTAFFPAMVDEIEEIRLYRFGHAQVVPYPGFLTFLKGTFPRHQGRLILSHSDLEGLPCVEAAIVQGQQAARRARIILGEQ